MVWAAIGAGVLGLGGAIYGSNKSASAMEDANKETERLQKLQRGYYEDAGLFADELANQPYTRYPGDRFAGMSPYTQQAMNYATMGQGSFLPYVEDAGGYMARGSELADMFVGMIDPATGGAPDYSSLGGSTGVGGEGGAGPIEVKQWSEKEAHKYMSPYISNALQPTIDKMMKAAKLDITGKRGSAAAQGALGGTRQAVLEASTEGEALKNVADVTAEGMERAYSNAQTTFASDADRDANAQIAQMNASSRAGTSSDQASIVAAQLASKDYATRMGAMTQAMDYMKGMAGQSMDIGNMLQGMQGVDIDRMLGMGQLEQQDRQRYVDLEYDEWLTERDWAERGMSYYLTMAGQTPMQQPGPYDTTDYAGLYGGAGTMLGGLMMGGMGGASGPTNMAPWNPVSGMGNIGYMGGDGGMGGGDIGYGGVPQPDPWGNIFGGGY